MGKTLQYTDQLITAFKENNQKVMQQVYQNAFPRFRNHVLKNSGNEAQAKDVFQEAFIACWLNIKEDKLNKGSNLEAYLFSIAKNKWIDFLRSSEFKKKANSVDLSLLKVAPDDESSKMVNDQLYEEVLQLALSQLGESCKSLLHMFYFDRMSMDTIAESLQITSASVRNQKYRCMEKLRALSLKIKKNG